MSCVKRFSDQDSQFLRQLIKNYGIDGLTHELYMLCKSWKMQNPKLYSLLERRAASLAYVARLMLGKAPLRIKVGN